MSNSTSLNKAIEIVQQAIDDDNKGNYADAYRQYQNALDFFMHALKYEKNEKSKVLIKSKVDEYLSRAETLKEHLAQSEKKGKNAIATGASGPGGKKKDTEENDDDQDPETKKLRAGLSGAILTEKPNVQWDDVAGLDAAKNSLKEASYLAKAVATEAKSTFFSVSSSDLVSKWQGDSERLVKQLFQLAREQKPSIIFIDEIDSLAGSRNESESEGSRRIKTEFLVQMNGVGHDDAGVLVLGATNIPWQLDNAIKRRFEKRIYIPLPSRDARKRMFQIHVGTTPCQLSDADYAVLAEKTEGYSGSDIAVVVRDALMQPVRKVISATHFKQVQISNPDSDSNPQSETGTGKGKWMWTPCSHGDREAVEKTWTDIGSDELLEPPLKLTDFLKSLDSTPPTVNEKDVKKHLEWTREAGSDGA
ncbi:katanin p60 ATPase domain-containing protein [Ephemerocybe angulata]|uniref:vesicle-fusing ATPase n=1 Tax=Ephemerocybe angulata TaxID=980116 RepID=A0A8H6HT33_9AGAR|nr:katanin p60 ATPase domain-containing protein [Tulosesus angulatus]